MQRSVSPNPSAFPLRTIGRTGLTVTELGIGTVPIGDLYARVSESEAEGMLQAGHELGVRLFDTAPLYGAGLAEHRTGRVLRQKPRDGVVISTKVGRWYSAAPRGADRGNWAGGLEFDAHVDYSYDGAMRAFEQSLLRLGLPRVDILLIHDVDVHTHGSREACDQRFDQAMEGAYRALCELRRAGDVKAIGVGVNEADMCARFAQAGEFDCMLLAGRYSLLDQSALDEFLPVCEKKQVSVLVGGVFNSGILASGSRPGAKFHYTAAPDSVQRRVQRLEQICRAHGVAMPAVAVQFPLAHPRAASVVLGAASADEIRQNVGYLRQPIPKELWAELKHVGILRSDAPVPS